MSCGTRQPRSLAVSAGANVKAGPAHARARFGGGHPRPLCRPVGRRSETWWRTGWTLWRAWRANFLRTVSGLTAPMSIRGRPRSHETRTAKAPLAGLRASLPAPGVGDLDQAVETAGASTVLRFGADLAGHASKRPGQRGRGGKSRTQLGVHGSKTIPRGF